MTPKLAKILLVIFLVVGTLIPIVYNVWQKQEMAQAKRRNQIPELKTSTSTPTATVAPELPIAPVPSPTPLLQFSISRGQRGFEDDD